MSDEILLQIAKDVGEMKGMLNSHIKTVDDHIGHDERVQKAIFERIEVLQTAHAKQRGFLSALSMLVSLVGAGVGYIVEKWILHH